MEIESIIQTYGITPYGLGHPTDHDVRNLLAQSTQIEAAAAWAQRYLCPQQAINRRVGSNGLKWVFEHDPAGGNGKIGLSNGAMIVALVAAGLTVEPDGCAGEKSRYVYTNASQRSINRLTAFLYSPQAWHDQATTRTLVDHALDQIATGKPWRCGSCYDWHTDETMDVGAAVAVYRPGDRPPRIVTICDFCMTTKTREDVFQAVFNYV